MDYSKQALDLHEKHRGKIEIKAKVPLNGKNDLSRAYTPGVAEVCIKIASRPEEAYRYTIKANSVAVVTNGTAVLGLGNIGPRAALPVMEGKCLIFKKFANIDAYPICLDTQDPNEIIRIVQAIAPGFGAINLEDIKAPECFEIKDKLTQILDIPLLHDDQDGTAIAVLAALINGLKVVGKKLSRVNIIVNGAGAAGISVTHLLLSAGAKNIVVLDRQGAIFRGRDRINEAKKEISRATNLEKKSGRIEHVIDRADVFIGVSAGNVLKKEWVKKMSARAIVFAMANPIPEIMPDQAKAAGAEIIATGRSDFDNQINNALVFPGLFRGLLDNRINQVTENMKLAVAQKIASLVKKPTANKILPSIFNKKVVLAIAQCLKTS